MKRSLFVLLLCASCHSDGPPRDPFRNQYRVYSGEQNWRTSKGSFVHVVKGIPIYYNFPDQRYEVLGSVTIDEEDEDGLASCAIAHSADAVLIMHVSHEQVGIKQDPGMVFADSRWAVAIPGSIKPVMQTSVTAYIIRFLPGI